MEDFEEAKDKIMLGMERKSVILSDDEVRTTAYHEAGHTLVSLAHRRERTRSTRSRSSRGGTRSG